MTTAISTPRCGQRDGVGLGLGCALPYDHKGSHAFDPYEVIQACRPECKIDRERTEKCQRGSPGCTVDHSQSDPMRELAGENVPQWFLAELENERAKLLRLCNHGGTLIPSERGQQYLEALRTVQSLILILRARGSEARAVPFQPGDVIAYVVPPKYRIDSLHEVNGEVRAEMTMIENGLGREVSCRQFGGPCSLENAIVLERSTKKGMGNGIR